MAITRYEAAQAYNPVTAWLHSFRYQHALSALSSIKTSQALRIVDIGSGPAKLFNIASTIRPVDYTGIEIDDGFVAAARERYGDCGNFRILHESAMTGLGKCESPDVIIALETLEHIPEHDVVRIVEMIVAKRPKRFICSVPIEIGPALWLKNLGSAMCGYNRHTEYTWVETFWAGLHRLDRLRPHGVGHRGFDWRWLAQTIRHNMRIRELRTFPFNLPAAVSTSIFIEAEPYPCE